MPPLETDFTEQNFVGDRFWLHQAAKLTADAVPQLNAQAVRLTTAVSWFWTAYLAAVGLGTLFEKVSNAAAVIPALTLLISYLFAFFAQTPVVTRLDPRSPAMIRARIESIILSKRRRLAAAQAFVVISVLALCAVIVSAASIL